MGHLECDSRKQPLRSHIFQFCHPDTHKQKQKTKKKMGFFQRKQKPFLDYIIDEKLNIKKKEGKTKSKIYLVRVKKHVISIFKFVIKTISTTVVPTSVWVMVKSTTAPNSHPKKPKKQKSTINNKNLHQFMYK